MGRHLAEGAAAHDVDPCLPQRLEGPGHRTVIEALEYPVDLAVRPADEAVDRHVLSQDQLSHGTASTDCLYLGRRTRLPQSDITSRGRRTRSPAARPHRSPPGTAR